MITQRKSVFKTFTSIVLWLLFFHVCVMIKHSLMSHQNSETDEKIELKCEQIWNQVLEIKERKFTSRNGPTHMIANEFLEIVTSNKTRCDEFSKNSESSNVRVAVVIVNSERLNFKERKIIRESWGSMKQWESWKIKTVFLLGQTDYCLQMSQENEARAKAKSEEEEISKEVEKFGDIIIGSFTDSIKNNTYKHLMGYKFVLESCPMAELIIKTEDNIFLNLPEVLMAKEENSFDMLCESSKNLLPVRCSKCENRKYYVNEKEWSSERYPQYCKGNLLAVSKEWAENLYEARILTKFFWIEEVFVTGLLREAAEKEFEKDPKLYKINNMIKRRNAGEDWINQLCENVDRKNLEEKGKDLGIYETVEGEKAEQWMKCLWNIVSGSYLPLRLK